MNRCGFCESDIWQMHCLDAFDKQKFWLLPLNLFNATEICIAIKEKIWTFLREILAVCFRVLCPSNYPVDIESRRWFMIPPIQKTWAQGDKTLFMLNSAENEICSAYKR